MKKLTFLIISNEIKTFKNFKKSNHYTRLIPFRVSRVSGAHLHSFVPGPTRIKVATVASRWQRVGHLKI